MSHDHEETGESRPLGLDLEAWEAARPSDDFAERVLERIRAEDAPRAVAAPPRPSRRWAVFSSGVAALALAAAVLLHVTAAPEAGESLAKARTTVSIGSRAVAVLEPGAELRWHGDDVVQTNGDAFYRVEPGKHFTVHTPAGDVGVQGTCFTVKVRHRGAEKIELHKRDVKSGAAGAELSALAFVAVYEGEVAVSHASERRVLQAGQSAQVGPRGVTLTGADGAAQFEQNAASDESDDPTTKVNQSLVRQVGEYRSRLEALAKQKTDLETKLQKSEASLAARKEGAPDPSKSEFDLSEDDWREMAKEGTVKYRIPCIDIKGDGWTPSSSALNAAGLSPQDARAIKDAYARSSKRLWETILPLCVQAVGSESVATRLGPDVCMDFVMQTDREKNPTAASEAYTQIAEIRAGVRPMPGPKEPLGASLKLLLLQTGANKAFEDDLAESFGPEEAHRLAYSDELCAAKNRHTTK